MFYRVVTSLIVTGSFTVTAIYKSKIDYKSLQSNRLVIGVSCSKFYVLYHQLSVMRFYVEPHESAVGFTAKIVYKGVMEMFDTL